MSKFYIPLIAALALAGCGSLNEAYVKADEATYNAVAPGYLRYLASDAALSSGSGKDLRESCEDTVKSWKSRIDEAKKALAGSGK